MAIATFFATFPIAFLCFALLLGLIIGSFLNVVIYRLPVMMQHEWAEQCYEFLELENSKKDSKEDNKKQAGDFSGFNLSSPGSHCPNCKHEISALENIPVLSYLLQGGKCKNCKNSISLRYPIIESACGIFTVLIASQYGFSWLTLAILILTWSLIVLTMIDYDHQLLPDDITMPILWLGLLINYFELITTLEAAVLGAIAGYLILWTVYWLFKLLTGKEGMGHGDFKLLAALGAWMGWQALPQIILLSSLIGALLGIGLIIIKGRDKNIPIPFGPYLAGAGFVSLLWNDELSQLYTAIFM
ncbi:MAG: prepilin peptidase [SAR86 cluster bacterium]|uniref:Prepilin leader peptidase/N-methyltransferase n=1 Tax=SAR86 cluster bacterium TaxID=2030880 RepID=A0A2A5CAZ3_9GAMM|nr:MAG: prepilin peptidase [SAR86 cluster bacterium]